MADRLQSLWFHMNLAQSIESKYKHHQSMIPCQPYLDIRRIGSLNMVRRFSFIHFSIKDLLTAFTYAWCYDDNYETEVINGPSKRGIYAIPTACSFMPAYKVPLEPLRFDDYVDDYDTAEDYIVDEFGDE